MNNCEKCLGKEYCVSKYTTSAWCKNMSEFRIFKMTFKDSKKIFTEIICKDTEKITDTV